MEVLRKVGVCVPYGPLKPGLAYNVIGETVDAVKIKNNGKVIHVMFDLLTDPPSPKKVEDLDYEDFISSNYF